MSHPFILLDAIPYHFGGKEGVYLAVAEQITARIAPQIQRLQNELANRIDKETPQALLLELTLSLADIAFTPEHQTSWFIFLTREQFHPTAAADILHRGFILPAHNMIGTLLARITGTQADSADIILLTQIDRIFSANSLFQIEKWPHL